MHQDKYFPYTCSQFYDIPMVELYIAMEEEL